MPAEGRLVVEEAGAGPPLVMVHGYLGSARHWDVQAEAFAASFRCLMPNLAGFGASSGLPRLDSIAGHAAAVLDALEELGVERFHLLGHSMGGMVVQQMAAMAPGRIERLVLYGTGPRGVLPGRFETIEASRQRLLRDGLEATARRIAATWFRDGEAAAGFDLCLAEAKRATLDAALASLTAWEGWDGRPALPALSMPTLVLWGDGDRSYEWSQPEALWRGIPGARLAVVPGCAHAVHMEKPDLFNALVLDFLGDAA